MNAFDRPAHSGLCRVAVLTPAGRGAVASVSVTGAQAVALVSRLFRPATAGALDRASSGRLLFGTWREGAGPGEEVVVCRLAPDNLEVHCHGGLAAADAIVHSLVQAGAEQVDCSQWAGRFDADPLAAEARLALAQARTERTAAILLEQHRGALRQALLQVIASLEAGAADPALRQLRQLLRYADVGLHLTTPWRVVLAGPVNVGKSSLLNALLGYQRAIVFNQPGTTRDVVWAHTALDGWPIQLADTAGLRSHADALEADGIALAQQQQNRADLVLRIHDASRDDRKASRGTPCDPAAGHHSAQRRLDVWNKWDLVPSNTRQPEPAIVTSALTGQGVEQLQRAILAQLVPHPPPSGMAVPFTTAQVDCLRGVSQRVTQGTLSLAAVQLRRLCSSPSTEHKSSLKRS